MFVYLRFCYLVCDTMHLIPCTYVYKLLAGQSCKCRRAKGPKTSNLRYELRKDKPGRYVLKYK